MGHPYRIREIAQQCGLSEATVDRVLNARVGVRASTIAEVRQAIVDLDRQAGQVRLAGQTFLVDLVMVAPRRFTGAVRTALERELSQLRPEMVRARFHLAEEGEPVDVVSTLSRVQKRGSHGVLLKAPDHPLVATAVAELAAAGIPTVTIFTDIPSSVRVGYVGIDNRAAGATAAYLIARMATASDRGVLMSLSSSTFHGEEERAEGFRGAMVDLAPDRPIVEVSDTDGLDDTTYASVERVLASPAALNAVYSIGGGNVAILTAFRHAQRPPPFFVAHDLDDDNLMLLRRRQLTAVLHHDLRADLQAATRLILHARGALPGRPSSQTSQIQVIIPYNEPDR